MAIQVTTNLICNEKWVSWCLQFISTYTFLFVCLLGGGLEPPKPPHFDAPGNEDWGLGLEIWIGDWDCGFGLGSRIGDWD